MAKQWFNQAEYYLLTKWNDALLMERAMKAVREKCTQILDAVLDRVQGGHQDLDCRGFLGGTGWSMVALGRSSWPSKGSQQPSGLRLWNISLDQLVSGEGDPPQAGITLFTPPEMKLDHKRASDRLRKEAPRVLQPELVGRLKVDSYSGSLDFYYPLPESREELFDLLVRDCAHGFIECLVGHLETLTGFLPVIDEIFQSAKRPRK